ncbi:drug resistance transporter, EmrB/QacA subfamily [Nonomuraea maritima]|uniref:Drug resistance transporter, EmrB/QacA subfamily n=1 Tax=Nonomuraea maritima TaxID=683260 RepID=A0A1G9JEN7_9ACTN|nr:MFS transporter [Nonomuraea maritima]SDL35908.1 drug resistance transporter, EmrB/QacA subfamily [Nonomuraea maritima]
MAAGTARGAGSDTRSRALALCLTAAFMTGLDVSIVNVALPSIRSGLAASDDGLQWTLSGYALTFGLLLVPAGRLGDARSRRTMFLWGVVLFTLASAACGFAMNMHMLIVARLIQGLAAGMLNPQVSGLLQQMFQGYERGRAFGALGATIGVSTAAGPLIGGALVTAFGADHGWRWVFLVNLPIGAVLLPVAWRVLPRPQGSRRHESIDPVGVLLLGVGVAALLLPFIQRNQWAGGGKWLLVPLAFAIIGGFVLWERLYKREPLIDLELFRRRSYRLGSTIALFYFAGFTGIFFAFTLYLQNGHGYSPLLAGLAVTPFALGSASAAVVGGRLVWRAGRRLTATGLAMVIVGISATMGATVLVPGPHVGWATALPLLVAGMGSGLVISPNQAITLSEVPPEGGGSAAGVLQTGQRLGSAIGIAAAGSTFFGSLGQGWGTALRHGLLVVVVAVAIALLAACYDLVRTLYEDRRAGDSLVAQ